MEEHVISNNGPTANFEMMKDCHGNGRDVEYLQEILGLEPGRELIHLTGLLSMAGHLVVYKIMVHVHQTV